MAASYLYLAGIAPSACLRAPPCDWPRFRRLISAFPADSSRFLRPRILGLDLINGEFLGKSKGIHRMLKRALAKFVSRLVISLVVSNGSGLVSVTRQIV
jgi:hypothetical protein